MRIRIGAAHFDLRVETPKGINTYDLSKMNDTQLAGVRELVVNYWARNNGYAELYTNND